MNVRSLAVARSVAVIGGMGALITGVTFAALTAGPARLSNNTLSTASADLQISNGGEFNSTVDGFAIKDLVPGMGSEHKKFYLKNTGAVDLQLAASVTKDPAVPAGGYGFEGMQNLKVYIKNLSTNETLSTDMAALLAGDVAMPGKLAAKTSDDSGTNGDQEKSKVKSNSSDEQLPAGSYEIWYDITPSAIVGEKAGVGAFNLEFTGSQSVGTEPSPSPTPTTTPAPTVTPSPTVTPEPTTTPAPTTSPSAMRMMQR